jgi:hypothetical protein
MPPNIDFNNGEKYKSLTIWTIVLSFLIIIGIGHGIAFIGLLEIGGLFNWFRIGTEYFSLSLSASYDKSLAAAAIFAFGGHILLIRSLLEKRYTFIFWTKISALLFLWTSFLYLSHNIFNDNASEIGFFTGIPFFVCSIILAYKIIRENLYRSDN